MVKKRFGLYLVSSITGQMTAQLNILEAKMVMVGIIKEHWKRTN